jgi:hypothetical protein
MAIRVPVAIARIDTMTRLHTDAPCGRFPPQAPYRLRIRNPTVTHRSVPKASG